MVDPLFPVTLQGAVSRKRGKVLLGPVDLTLNPSGTTAVIGPNGSGKTTFLRLLHGTARLHQGSVTWALPRDEVRARQAFVFQRPILLRRSVAENMAYPMELRGMPRAQIASACEDWAARVGLTDLMHRPAQSLSGGEQQKLALARALITDPDVLFLDEPCAALDGRATREIEAILAEAEANGARLFLATHDMGQARRMGSDVIFLLKGQVHETGSAPEVFAGPKTTEMRAFLQGDIVE